METLYTGSWHHSPGPAQIARHNLDSARYNADFTDLPRQGYRPICVSGGGNGGGFSSIWEKSAGAAWIARHAMSSSDYQREFDAATAQGYRLRCINGYQEGGQARFAALWDQSGGPAWRARHDMNAGEYQQAFDDNGREGYRPTWLTVYAGNGEARYAGLWEQSTAPGWVVRHNIGADDFKKTMEEHAIAGWRFVCGNGCGVQNSDVYAGIWEAVPGQQWAACHGLNADDFQKEFDRRVGEGHHPRFVASYQANRRQHLVQPWYVAVQLVGLSGAGSDVDEIYGVLAAAVYDAQGQLGVRPGSGDVVQELIRINGSLDLSDGETTGRYAGKLFQMPSNVNSGTARLALRSYMYDEDDARDDHPNPDGPDSGNDEHFAFVLPTGQRSYVHNLQLNPPAAGLDSADFSREMRVQLHLDAKGNSLTAAVKVRWFRDSNFVPPV